MKLKVLLFTSIAGISYLTLSSYSGGPSTSAGHVAISGCGSTGNCHGAKNTATVVAITVKDGATTITNNKYTAGKKYTITITGTNSSYSKFGYQFSATKGSSGIGTISNVPSGSKISNAGGISVAEQSGTITAASGLSVSFDWTAPATGSGTVTLSAAVNGVDGTGSTNNDAFNTAQVTLTESTTGIATANVENAVQLYPNPATSVLHIQLNNAGVTSGYIYNSYGQKVKEVNLTGQNNTADIAELQQGTYYLYIAAENATGKPTMIPFTKL